jgi:hypothetical protein
MYFSKDDQNLIIMQTSKQGLILPFFVQLSFNDGKGQRFLH